MNLALEFRPKKLDSILGQKELVAVFKKFLNMQKLPHSIFFGVAGSGKTSFARAVANDFGLDFYEFDGGNFKLEELRKIIEKYKESLYKPLIFIDEIHRLNKTQQEMLLVPMENYRCIIIGASTENPYFVLSSGIRSRSMLFEFKALKPKELEILLQRVQKQLQFDIDEDAKDFILKSADARAMLNVLEFALVLNPKQVSLENLRKLRPNIQSEGVSSKDTHYLLASALIKSLRGSDVDAALYYLARLIEGGESADFIARRLVIFASEDIGNADTNALNLAVNTLQGVKNIGYPEARILLAQCVVYLASSIKSNSSYKAIEKALDFVKNNEALEIPSYLNNHSSQNYLYPHDFGGWVEQKYLTRPLNFYHSKGKGDEARLLENLKKMKENSCKS
ncbi:replication-associated recombination protein A [Campylobacter cuniculorum]|uniref:Replication-associated recombination protein A n=2 Tax=Campylobacter cuniculorum TaxID=374106 RepID=A0A1W6BY65_9BACT|nr:replication-associated recombination protein A [Campylobacter cuniculorum]ARJ57024.1 recombination factor protein RarA [Campylobacter cuniculorum DSM 23162 = LMG 24588]QOR04474.1 replication-associated recombination protein A [Campylobacter cuniculorum]